MVGGQNVPKGVACSSYPGHRRAPPPPYERPATPDIMRPDRSPSSVRRRQPATPAFEVVQRRSRPIFGARVIVLAVDAMTLAAVVAYHRSDASVAYAGATLLGCLALTKAHKRFAVHAGDDLASIVVAAACGIVVTPFAGDATEVERLVVTLPVVVAALLIGRALSYGVIRRLRATPARRRRIVLVGSGRTAADLVDAADDPALGIDIVGYVASSASTLAAPWLGHVTDLYRAARVRSLDHVIVTTGRDDDATAVEALRACKSLGIGVSSVPRMFRLGAISTGASVEWLGKTPIVHSPAHPKRVFAWKLKRAFDVVASLALLVVLAPVFGLIALAIRLRDPGPVLFKQDRITDGGRPFRLLKFRTLPVNDGSDTRWDGGDLHPSRLGLFLRKSGLDELPQLINIARGEMSLVGPRPERPHFVERFSRTIESYPDRLRVPAGLTGWSQIHGLRGDTSIQDRADLDNDYIERWSLWRDFAILLRTPKTFVRREGR
jgi:exopolysaccharide biosynthesis polyprenyl glycosylphosphotransferase